MEGFFLSKNKDANKIKAAVIFLQDEARVWFDTLKRDQETVDWDPFQDKVLSKTCFRIKSSLATMARTCANDCMT